MTKTLDTVSKKAAKILPIISITAHALVENREKFLNASMNGYLTKPLQKIALFAEIMKHLSFMLIFEKE